MYKPEQQKSKAIPAAPAAPAAPTATGALGLKAPSMRKTNNELPTYLTTAWPILLLMLLVGLGSYLTVSGIAKNQDIENASNSQQLLTKSLESQTVANFIVAKELSVSSGAYENITLKQDFSWIGQHYQSPNTTAIFVYSATKGLVFTNIAEQFKQHQAEFQKIANEVGRADAMRQTQEQLTNDFKRDDPVAFVLLGNDLATVSSQPIGRQDWGPGEYERRAEDYVITIKYLGEFHAQTTAAALGLKQLAFVSRPVGEALQSKNAGYKADTSPKISLAVKDSDGVLLGWFDWIDEKRGTAAFHRQMLPIGSGLVFLFILTAFITRRIFHTQQSAENARVSAEQANRLKSSFLANMSHELRTPLNAIIGYSEMLGEDCVELNNEVGASDAKKITRSAYHLLSLINDLLDHSKIEAGKMDLNPQVHDIGVIVADVADALGGRIADNNSTLEVHGAQQIGDALCDGMRLKQCLLNLVSNAAKFTKSGTITIEATQVLLNNVPSIQVRVKDTGIGMSPQTLKKLFSPFVQADETTAQNFGGTGLGLVITKRLIEAMGGSVRVESTLQVGSTFTLVIPRGMDWSDSSGLEAVWFQEAA